MPLYDDGFEKIRHNLIEIQAGRRVKTEVVGCFTLEQLAGLNEIREAEGFQPLIAEIKFKGRHLYESRCLKNGYTVDQVVEQIESALSEASIINCSPPSTTLRNPVQRTDHDGIPVNDEAVFECTGGFPYAILFSVVPRGDGRLVPRTAKGPPEE